MRCGHRLEHQVADLLLLLQCPRRTVVGVGIAFVGAEEPGGPQHRRHDAHQRVEPQALDVEEIIGHDAEHLAPGRDSETTEEFAGALGEVLDPSGDDLEWCSHPHPAAGEARHDCEQAQLAVLHQQVDH